jgi:hypothetical protein
MKIYLFIALILNLFVIGINITVLLKLKRKLDIIKYYTYFHALLLTIINLIYSFCIIMNLLLDNKVPEYIKGLKYVSLCGVLMASFVYVVFLSRKESNRFKDDDFKRLNPKLANIFLHYVSPLVMLLSFVFFERSIELNNSIWTVLAIIPTALYWLMYLVFTILKVWNEPYDFSSENKFYEIISYISIPVAFILISFILWNIK